MFCVGYLSLWCLGYELGDEWIGRRQQEIQLLLYVINRQTKYKFLMFLYTNTFFWNAFLYNSFYNWLNDHVQVKLPEYYYSYNLQN